MFPFLAGLSPNIPAFEYANDPRAGKIASAEFNELREAWLNPPDLVSRIPEIVPDDLPDQMVPLDNKAVEVLKKRTLTNLYNERPAWLVDVHRGLDVAVAEAYGWSVDISDKDALTKLLALNLER